MGDLEDMDGTLCFVASFGDFAALQLMFLDYYFACTAVAYNVFAVFSRILGFAGGMVCDMGLREVKVVY